jgi:hypothetical protein
MPRLNNYPCPICGEYLIAMDWNSFCYLIVCKNDKCQKAHVPAGRIVKNSELECVLIANGTLEKPKHSQNPALKQVRFHA